MVQHALRAAPAARAWFDPSFDDAVYTDAWRGVPLRLPPPGRHPAGYRISARAVGLAEVFGRTHAIEPPLDARVLLGPDGRLWMSTMPQELAMMWWHARRSRGHVLVGGLGLGVYPQFVREAARFTVIERSPAVREMVEPTLRAALGVPLEVRTGTIEALLSGQVGERYDTVFLDTWDTVDAAHLPRVNRLRDLARRHLAPGGVVLLWGYRWMVRLFEQGCRALLAVPPNERPVWLAAQRPAAVPPLAAFARYAAERGPTAALAECRSFAHILSAEC